MASGIAAGNVQYTQSELMGLWNQAGGNQQNAAIASAIAMAESGGNSAAYDIDSNGTIDRGLWQINSVHGSQSSYDVMTNVRAAISISNNGTNWRPWCTAWSSGACSGTYLGSGAPVLKFLNPTLAASYTKPINATNAAANQPTTGQSQQAQLTGAFSNPFCVLGTVGCLAGDGLEQVLPNSLNPTNLVSGILKGVLNPLVQYAAGALGVFAGGVLVLTGMFFLVRQTQVGQRVSAAGGAAAGAGVTGVGWLTGNTEVMAAGAAMRYTPRPLRGGARSRIATIRGQRVTERQAYRQAQITGRMREQEAGASFRQARSQQYWIQRHQMEVAEQLRQEAREDALRNQGRNGNGSEPPRPPRRPTGPRVIPVRSRTVQ